MLTVSLINDLLQLLRLTWKVIFCLSKAETITLYQHIHCDGVSVVAVGEMGALETILAFFIVNQKVFH